MRHSKKKTEHSPLPDQDAMGSADDYAPGATQGDGQSGDPTFAGSAGAAADADPNASARDQSPAGADPVETTPDSNASAERDRYLRLAAEYDNYRKRSARERQDAGSRAQADLARQLIEALGDAGLEVINPVGETFDPALHEAVATEPTSAKEDDHVVSRVYQPGYLFKSQLLRPARVVVKQWNG